MPISTSTLISGNPCPTIKAIYINQDDDLIITVLLVLAASATRFISSSLCSQDRHTTLLLISAFLVFLLFVNMIYFLTYSCSQPLSTKSFTISLCHVDLRPDLFLFPFSLAFCLIIFKRASGFCNLESLSSFSLKEFRSSSSFLKFTPHRRCCTLLNLFLFRRLYY